MRLITALLILGCALSLSFGQYVETSILLPDSVSGLTEVGSLVFHPPTNTIYVGGDESLLVAVNAQTNVKLKRVAVGEGPHVLCSDPPGNKVYCADYYGTVTVIDGATNQPVKTLPVEQRATDLCYNGPENKLYCGNTSDSFVRVIDCVGDSVVARVPVSLGPGALCYNPQLNRIYCADLARDEVSVIDCTADTVVGTVWVRGVEPQSICYDSATNCVYTANYASSTVSVLDCAGDTLVRLVPVGRGPVVIEAGPPGKVYCANYDDSSVSVISGSGVKTVRACTYPKTLSYDPVNKKVCCGNHYWSGSVTVIDAVHDTAVAQVSTGSYPMDLCHNPAGNNTYVGCSGDDVVSVIGGVSDTVEAVITFGAPCYPGPLCYNTTNNRLYCLDYRTGLLFVIDGDSSRVLKAMRIRSDDYNPDALIWNPVSNKVYIANSGDSTVSILDCASDSIVATVATGQYPCALCCSEDGKVYVANEGGGVAVIDGSGDSVRTVLPINDSPWSLCYDRTDNKVYVGKDNGDGDTISVIDADGDSVVATILVPYPTSATVCWNQNHDKTYVGDLADIAVVDCTGDTVLRNIGVTGELDWTYSDSVCDKVYGVDSYYGYLRIIRASTDTFYQSLSVGFVTALMDNGKQGPANRLYCTDDDAGVVTVIRGYKADSILCRISVGAGPSALAWNPAYSRMYVSNSGSSSITVIRDTVGVGVEESQPQATGPKPQATVVRGVLVLGAGSRQNAGYRAELLDISGRKVLDLKPGVNDVRALAPGVYFVREVQAQAQAQAQAVRKIVITR